MRKSQDEALLAFQPQPKGQPIMGDKSPKSVKKKASQKQALADSADAKKRQAIASKQSSGKKK